MLVWGLGKGFDRDVGGMAQMRALLSHQNADFADFADSLVDANSISVLFVVELSLR